MCFKVRFYALISAKYDQILGFSRHIMSTPKLETISDLIYYDIPDLINMFIRAHFVQYISFYRAHYDQYIGVFRAHFDQYTNVIRAQNLSISNQCKF